MGPKNWLPPHILPSHSYLELKMLLAEKPFQARGIFTIRKQFKTNIVTVRVIQKVKIIMTPLPFPNAPLTCH